MLLVADDANAAYSNPRPLPKCAQTLLPCIQLAYRTPRRPDAVCLSDSKNTSTRVGTGTNATLDDMGYRGEDVSATHGAWGRQTPWQSSSDDYQGADSGARLRTRRRLPGTGPARLRRATGSRTSSTAALTASSRRRISTGSLTSSTTATSRAAAAPRAAGAPPATAGAARRAVTAASQSTGRATTVTSAARAPADTPRAATTRRRRPDTARPAGTRARLTAATRARQAAATRPGHDGGGYQDRHRRLRPVRRIPGTAPSGGYPALPAAARAAIRPRTRETTGTAASPPRRAAGASLTPARTGSTGGPSTSTARARAAHCAIRCAATRPARSKTPASCPRP